MVNEDVQLSLYRVELRVQLEKARKRRDFREVNRLQKLLQQARTEQLKVENKKSPLLHRLSALLNSFLNGWAERCNRPVRKVSKVTNGNLSDALHFNDKRVSRFNKREKITNFHMGVSDED